MPVAAPVLTPVADAVDALVAAPVVLADEVPALVPAPA